MSVIVGYPVPIFSIVNHQIVGFTKSELGVQKMLKLWILVFISDASLADIFQQLEKSGSPGPDNCAVFVCHRHEHVPVLHVRDAK